MKIVAGLGTALLLAFAYLLNLGSPYAPTNGDEMVYLHIARLTSESGHWLPLVSELQTPTGSEMRNTKPPFLFWQAMAAGSWRWDLFTLRLPYVLETLLTAALVGWLTNHLIGVRSQLNKGLLAAALYLGFFATYRYGRPVLPSSIESLFLFGVCALAITKLTLWMTYPIRLAALIGLLMIPALLSKSFMLAAPVGLWFFLSSGIIQTDARPSPLNERLAQFGLSLSKALLPATIAAVIGLAGFALWLAVDPNPSAVWREFIIGENFATKFSAARADSLFVFWLSPLVNAGLLCPLVIGLFVAALQAIRNKAFQLSSSEKLLWLWLLVWLTLFSLPSTRSARYVIPVMPAIAVLISLYADRIHRAWWMLTLALIASATVALGWIAHGLDGVFPVGQGYSPLYFVAIGLLLLACGICFLSARCRVMLTALIAVVWLALLGALAAPFDRDLGHFDARVTHIVGGEKVLLPQNFNAQFERFQFSLNTVPRVQPLPYMTFETVSPESLLHRAPYAVITLPLGIMTPAQNESFNIVASRLVLRSRHSAPEITWERITDAKTLAHLLVEREVLIGTKN